MEKMTFKEICAEKCRAKDDFIKLLQEATGVSLATVYRWVNGFSSPHPRDRNAIAKVLNSSVDVLFESK